MAADALRWWGAMTDREEPTWHSPNELVLESPTAALRDFSQGSRKQVVPTLVLPPQAGHHSCIVDYSAEQSQIETIRGAGLERVCVDGVARRRPEHQARRHHRLRRVPRALRRADRRAREPDRRLPGRLAGGHLRRAASRPVNTLTLAGSPIDFHAGEGPIHEWVKQLCSTGDMSFYEGLVAGAGGVMPGDYILGGFITIKPENELSKQLQLLANLDDPTHRRRYAEFEDWFKFTQDLPGDFYLWIVRGAVPRQQADRRRARGRRQKARPLAI